MDTPSQSDKHLDLSERDRQIYEFLHAHPIGVLTSVDPNGRPHGVVIYYSVDKKFNFTFTAKAGTKKHDNISRDGNVMLVVYEAYSQTTTQISGIAEEVTDKDEATKIYSNTLRASMNTSEAGVPPISKLFAGNYVAYKIKPKQIRYAVFERPDPGSFDLYETIDF